MMRFFGIIAAINVIYIASAMLIAGKMPSRAPGLLGIILIAPLSMTLLKCTSGFISGFMYVILLIALAGYSLRLLLGKRTFSIVVSKPLRNITKTWFEGRGKRYVRDVWSSTRKK